MFNKSRAILEKNIPILEHADTLAAKLEANQAINDELYLIDLMDLDENHSEGRAPSGHIYKGIYNGLRSAFCSTDSVEAKVSFTNTIFRMDENFERRQYAPASKNFSKQAVKTYISFFNTANPELFSEEHIDAFVDNLDKSNGVIIRKEERQYEKIAEGFIPSFQALLKVAGTTQLPVVAQTGYEQAHNYLTEALSINQRFFIKNRWKEIGSAILDTLSPKKPVDVYQNDLVTTLKQNIPFEYNIPEIKEKSIVLLEQFQNTKFDKISKNSSADDKSDFEYRYETMLNLSKLSR